MQLMLTATTGAKIVVWREGEMFHARTSGSARAPQVCLAVDLFEVIAELAGLDIDLAEHSAEAVSLAAYAQEALGY
jgi:hypothetical protein